MAEDDAMDEHGEAVEEQQEALKEVEETARQYIPEDMDVEVEVYDLETGRYEVTVISDYSIEGIFQDEQFADESDAIPTERSFRDTFTIVVNDDT